MEDLAVAFSRKEAESEPNPWSATKPEMLLDLERKLSNYLYRQNSELTNASLNSGCLKVFWAGYGIPFLLASFVFLITKPGASLIWGTYLFWIPFFWSVPSLIIYSNSEEMAKKKKLKRDLDSAVQIGLAAYKNYLEGRKYSSNSEGVARPVANFGVITPNEAEQLAAAWLRSLGFGDAQVTRYSRDGGIDVVSSQVVCQVKFQAANVGVKSVRELFGVSVEKGKKPIFFSKSSYSADALDFANKVGMPLIQLRERNLYPINASAELLLAKGPDFYTLR